MNQSDWVGGGVAAAQKPFKDIRNTRPSVAEEKAMLLLDLGAMLKKPPDKVINGDVKISHEWVAARAAAAKIAGSSRSSSQEIRTAINNMRRFGS